MLLVAKMVITFLIFGNIISRLWSNIYFSVLNYLYLFFTLRHNISSIANLLIEICAIVHKISCIIHLYFLFFIHKFFIVTWYQIHPFLIHPSFCLENDRYNILLWTCAQTFFIKFVSKQFLEFPIYFGNIQRIFSFFQDW